MGQRCMLQRIGVNSRLRLKKGDVWAVMDQTVIIVVNSGVGLRMIGNTGQYVKEFTDAMKFADEIEAYEYIERHGLEKLSSVRKY